MTKTKNNSGAWKVGSRCSSFKIKKVYFQPRQGARTKGAAEPDHQNYFNYENKQDYEKLWLWIYKYYEQDYGKKLLWGKNQTLLDATVAWRISEDSAMNMSEPGN